MPPLFIIFGSQGMLGHQLVDYITQQDYETISYSRADFDIVVDLSDLPYMFERIDTRFKDYDIIVVNCTGIIPHRKCDYYNTISVNTQFPHVLSKLCKKLKWKFIHITTDCVYDGLEGLYHERAIPNNTSLYSVSKSLGEPLTSTVIRTSIIGEEIYWKTGLLEWVKSNRDGCVSGYSNHLWNGVTCLMLSKIILQMYQHDIWWKGVRHITSPDIVSKCELINDIQQEYRLNVSVIPINTTKCNRSLTSLYQTNRLFNIPCIRVQIHELYNYKYINEL